MTGAAPFLASVGESVNGITISAHSAHTTGTKNQYFKLSIALFNHVDGQALETITDSRTVGTGHA